MRTSPAVSNLSPAAVWRCFEGISQIPRGSGKEERIGAYIRGFGLALGLDTQVDKVGNIVIRKPATKGMEDRATVALQSHIDMVQRQVDGRGFDFENDPIELIVDGDWLCANGTTLGADNGIGVAYALAVLASANIAHPAIEALFTVDEEVGMKGALEIAPDFLTAKYLINLDMEADDVVTIGCAGGMEVLAQGTYPQQVLPSDWPTFEVEVSGGTGGHSGLDIHLGRMNAIKALVSALGTLEEEVPIALIYIQGEGVPNVISSAARARFAIAPEFQDVFKPLLEELGDGLVPFKETDPNATIVCSKIATSDRFAFEPAFQSDFLRALHALPDGVIGLSAEIEDLVESSNNLAIVIAEAGRFNLHCLARTCKESDNASVFESIKNALAALPDVEINKGHSAPGWEPCPSSRLLQTAIQAISETRGTPPKVTSVHAGLEAGILSNIFPDMELVSYGPNILGAHSTQERVQISSVQSVWRALKRMLELSPNC